MQWVFDTRALAVGTALGFYVMVVTLIPLGIGPDLNLLARIGPAILWVAALLATLIGLDRLYQADHEDGSLDLLRASPLPLALVVREGHPKLLLSCVPP